MNRGGRPKMNSEQRRSLTLPAIKVNVAEHKVIEAKAKAAHLSVSAWQRYAAQERDPPCPFIIPTISEKAWLQLSTELQELRCLKRFFLAEGEARVIMKLEQVEDELKAVRNQLIGVVS